MAVPEVEIHDSVTICAMRLCNARQDRTITGDDFIRLLADYAREVIAAYEDVRSARLPQSRPNLSAFTVAPELRGASDEGKPAAADAEPCSTSAQPQSAEALAPDSIEHHADDGAPKSEAVPPSRHEAENAPADRAADVAVEQSAPGEPLRHRARTVARRMSYDDRVRIRARIEEKREEIQRKGGVRLPRGFLAGLALEFNYTEWQVEQVAANKEPN